VALSPAAGGGSGDGRLLNHTGVQKQLLPRIRDGSQRFDGEQCGWAVASLKDIQGLRLACTAWELEAADRTVLWPDATSWSPAAASTRLITARRSVPIARVLPVLAIAVIAPLSCWRSRPVTGVCRAWPPSCWRSNA